MLVHEHTHKHSHVFRYILLLSFIYYMCTFMIVYDLY